MYMLPISRGQNGAILISINAIWFGQGSYYIKLEYYKTISKSLTVMLVKCG